MVGGRTSLLRDFCLIAKLAPFPLRPAGPVLGDWELKTVKYREKLHLLETWMRERMRKRENKGKAATGGEQSGCKMA